MKRQRTVLAAVILVLVVPRIAYAEDPTVYITTTGQRYHLKACSSVRVSKIPITHSEAVLRGYTPCGRCRPPILASVPQSAPAGLDDLYRVNVANLASHRDADLSRVVSATVVRHVDGDTVHVAIKDPPAELQAVEHFGEEASEFTRDRLFEKPVLLAFDWDLRDRYGRLLAYIYLPDGACHNADLIREGYGHAYTRFPFQFLEEFRALERGARENRRRLWGGSAVPEA